MDALVNIYYMNEGSKLLVVCKYTLLLLKSDNFKKLKQVSPKASNDWIYLILSCRPALKDEFLIASYLSKYGEKKDVSPHDLLHKHKG
jgi:hypothetical protein